MCNARPQAAEVLRHRGRRKPSRARCPRDRWEPGGKPRTAASAAAQGSPRKPPASVHWREVQVASGGGASVPPALPRVTACRPREWQQPPGPQATASAVTQGAQTGSAKAGRLARRAHPDGSRCSGTPAPRKERIASPNGSAAGRRRPRSRLGGSGAGVERPPRFEDWCAGRAPPRRRCFGTTGVAGTTPRAAPGTGSRC